MKAQHKIDAIRIIRTLPIIIEEEQNSNGVMVQRIRVNASLRDLKELVESIMELGSNPTAMFEAEKSISLLKDDNTRLQRHANDMETKYYTLLHHIHVFQQGIGS